MTPDTISRRLCGSTALSYARRVWGDKSDASQADSGWLDTVSYLARRFSPPPR